MLAGHRPEAPGLVVIVGSMGALEPLRAILGELTGEDGLPVLVVRHGSTAERLAESLGAATARPVVPVRSGERLRRGTVHVAAGHTAVAFTTGRCMMLSAPAPDPAPDMGDRTLRAATRSYGARVFAVILSGRLDDGAEGVRAVRAAGGRVLVQDPDSAAARAMPNAAIATGCSELVLSPARIGAELLALGAG